MSTAAKRAWRDVAAAWLIALVAACGGHAPIGDPCDTAGETRGCEDGAVCTNQASGNVCRKLCTAQTDCHTGETCNGISGTSLKSCQPDSVKK
jgi:hypothetical protein